MPKRTAAHRGRYKARSKPTTHMPALLRRALAQLRGDPPESWPDIGEGFSQHYPFPMWIKMCAPHMNYRTARADLIAMLTRLSRADIGTAWHIINERCTDPGNDPGSIILLTLTESVRPVTTMSLAARTEMGKRVIAAAKDLSEAIEAMRETGASIDWLIPPDRTDSEEFFSALSRAAAYESTKTVRTARQRQIRGTKWQRIALYIAHKLRWNSDIPTAVTIANAATGVQITSKALTKPTKYIDYRGYHARLCVVATKEEAARVLAEWGKKELNRQNRKR